MSSPRTDLAAEKPLGALRWHPRVVVRCGCSERRDRVGARRPRTALAAAANRFVRDVRFERRLGVGSRLTFLFITVPSKRHRPAPPAERLPTR